MHSDFYNVLIKRIIMPSGKFQGKYRISSTRLRKHDYGGGGSYFITICTKNRQRHFGEIVGKGDAVGTGILTGNCPSLSGPYQIMQPRPIGQITIDIWNGIPNHYPMVTLDEFVLMPDHLHGIIHIKRPKNHKHQVNKFGIQSMNLPTIIRAFKKSAKRYANQNQIVFLMANELL